MRTTTCARCVGSLTAVLIAFWLPSLSWAYLSHYFVINEAVDGGLSVVAHQLVEISGAAESAVASAQPGRLESVITVAAIDKFSGQSVFDSLAFSSPWLRGEFDNHEEIDGHHLPVHDRLYVVRIPAAAGQVLRLRGTRALEQGVGSPSVAPASSPASTLNIDLDQYGPASASVAAVTALPPGAATGLIYNNGSPANRLDLLIVGDGYTAAQQAQFVSQATAVANNFLSISPYNDFRHLINVQWLFVPSNEAGADKPACAETPGSTVVVVDTAFDATFCTSGIRRLVTINQSKVLTAAASVPDWDKILVLVNDSEYGGSGGNISVATTNASSVGIMQHEFGHSFTKLADEYETAYPGYPDCSDLTASPNCEANVTDQTSAASLKWRDWVAGTTPIPTTTALADPKGAGLWLGARYKASGMYRQCFNGIMRALGRPFCNVDSEAFVKRLYGGVWGVPSTGVSLIEPGSTPTAATINAAAQSDITFRATFAGSLATGGLTATWLVDNVAVRVDATVHGATRSFTWRLPDAGTHSVELRVTDSTPFAITRPQRSRIWTVQGMANGLSVTTLGSGSGTVTSNPAGISCGGACTVGYATPTPVTLTAAPAVGSVFVGWLGACVGAGPCAVTAQGATTVSATFAPSPFAPRIDVDGNGTYHPLTDGVLLVRYLLGLSGAPLTVGALGATPTRSTPAAIAQYLDNLAPLLDVDGNGKVDAVTDGVMLIRYLFGLRGSALIAGAVGTGATRSASSQIEAQILPLTQ